MIPMSPEDAKADALARFIDPGPDHINCAQTVLRFALLVMGHDPAMATSASYFGGGAAGMGEICGAVSGTALSLGLRDYYLARNGYKEQAGVLSEGPSTRERLQGFMRGFAEEYGSLRCRDLTGFDLTTPDGHDAFMKSEARERCRFYVGEMCDRLLPLIRAGAPQDPAA
jgi:C_GCAxxG_C_C family probable redox protein